MTEQSVPATFVILIITRAQVTEFMKMFVFPPLSHNTACVCGRITGNEKRVYLNEPDAESAGVVYEFINL